MDPEVTLSRPVIRAADHPSGHDLIAIETGLDGQMSSVARKPFCRIDEHRQRFWRCRACGQERVRPDEFETVCPGGAAVALITDGGSPTGASAQPQSENLTVEFVDFGPGYGVLTPDGTRYIVDIEARTCGCDDHRATGDTCEHLARADLAILTGELPGPDGRYLG